MTTRKTGTATLIVWLLLAGCGSGTVATEQPAALMGACRMLSRTELETAIGPASLAPTLSGEQVDVLEPGQNQHCSFSAEPNSVTLGLERFESADMARDFYDALASADLYEMVEDRGDAAMWREVSAQSGAVTILAGDTLVDMWVWIEEGGAREVALDLAVDVVERLP